MRSFNKITLVAHLGRDPELRYTPTGNAVCNLSVATTERRKNNHTDEMEEATTWFRVTVWGRQAEMCNEYLKKGSAVYLEGRLSVREYTDREGQKRSSVEVNASDVQFLDKKGENGGEERQDAPTRKVAKQELARAVKQMDDDDLPF